MEEQVHTTCLRVAVAVKDLQMNLGLKDAFTQYWIDKPIDKVQDMQKLQPFQSPQEIQAELMIWVGKNKSTMYNSFLIMPGVLIPLHVKCYSYMSIGFDASCNTPVGILHKIIIGVVKISGMACIYHGWWSRRRCTQLDSRQPILLAYQFT